MTTAGREPTTSAAACLVLVARLHGIRVAPQQLRDVGDGWAGVEAALPRIGFRGRLVTSADDQLAEIAGAVPAVVRLRDGRHVVLTGVGEGADGPEVTVADPDRDGRVVTILRAAFMSAWSGEALLLRPERTVGSPGETRFGWRAILGALWRGGRLGRDLLVATVVAALLALGPVLFARALANETVTAQTPDTFWALTLGIAVLIAFEWAFALLRLTLARRLSARLDVGLDRLAFERLLGLPLGTFEAVPAAALARNIAAAQALASDVPTILARTALDGTVAILLFVVLLATSVGLAMLTAALVAFGAVLLFLLARRHSRAAAARAVAAAAVDDHLTETIAGRQAVKELALEARIRGRADVLGARVARLDIGERDAAGRLDVVASLLAWLVGLGPFAVGAALTVVDVAPLGRTDLFIVALVGMRLAAPLRDVSPLVRSFGRARAAIVTLRELVEAAPEAERGRPGLQTPVQGQFSFSGVRYTYPGALVPALDAVSFEVAAGSLYAIIGRSGAGKSTVARLLHRAGGDHDGLIKLDGIDVRQFDLDHLRRSVHVLGADAPLFAGTVRANLQLGVGSVSDDALMGALRVVGLDDVVERLPRGLATVLSEAVPVLSDGHRQRLAIARALLIDPAILVLDEATSAIDAQGEAALLADLRRASPTRTLVIISQRLVSVARADAILVLDRGEVQDIGRHAELVGRSDLYSGMWRRQAGRLRLVTRHDTKLPGRNVAAADRFSA